MKHLKLTTKKRPMLADCCDCICKTGSQKICSLKGQCPSPKNAAAMCVCDT